MRRRSKEPRPPRPRRPSRERREPAGGAGRDLAITVAWFGVLGVVAGVLWSQLAPEILATRTDAGVVLEADQLARQVGTDGWYAALAVVGGVVSGTVLVWWRWSRPVWMVLLVTLGGLLAAVLALQVGSLLGPPDANTALAAQAVGAQAPLDLRLEARGLEWAWSVAAVLGALVYLVVVGPDRSDDDPQVVRDSSPDAVSPR